MLTAFVILVVLFIAVVVYWPSFVARVERDPRSRGVDAARREIAGRWFNSQVWR